MRKLLVGLFLIGASAYAQGVAPDCGPTRFSFSAAPGNSNTFTNYTNNSGPACVVWEFRYSVAGSASAVSILVQAAPPASGTPPAPGTFVIYPGTAVVGAITNTNTAGATAILGDGATAVPFIRVHLTTFTATDGSFIYGVLQGWNAGNAAAIIAGNGSGGGCPNPCPVIQSDPTLLNGSVEGLDTAGSPPTHKPFLGASFDGTNLQNNFVCPNQVAFNIPAGTDGVIVTGTTGLKTYICHLDFASDTSATFTVRQGTGTTCLSNTAALTGSYPNTTTIAMDYQPTAPLHTTVNANDTCLHGSAAATVGGTALYIQK